MTPRTPTVPYVAGLALVAVLASSCGGHGEGSPSAPPSAGGDVVRTLDEAVDVARLDDAVDRVRRMAVHEGGYVQSANVTRGTGRRATLELRIPTARLDAVRRSAHALGEVWSEVEGSTDVGDQRTDLAARLHNARAEEARLLALLAGSTGNLADVLAVEREVSATRESIERMEAEDAALAERVAYARATFMLAERDVPFWRHPVEAVAAAGQSGAHAAASLLVGSVVVVAATAPTLASVLFPLAALALALRAVRRRRRVVAA